MTHTKKRLFIAGCMINIAGIWLAIMLQLGHDRRQAARGAEVNVSNVARAFEEHVLRTTQHVDSLLLQLREDYQHDPRHLDERIRFHKNLLHSERIIQISIVDARGLLVYNDQHSPPAPIDLSDREHFRVHRENGGDRLYISNPVLGRVSGKWSIQFTRRLAHPDGSFGGVMIVSVSPDYFSDFYRTVDLGKKGAITLLGTDGVIRARASGVRSAVEANGFRIPGPQPPLDPARPSKSVYRGVSELDGISRIVAYRRLQSYPLVVSVAVAEEEVFRAVDIRRNIMIGTGILVSVALLGGLVLILWLEREQLLLTRKLTDRDEQLRTTMAELERLATTDSLTELPNRRSFFAQAQGEFNRAQRYAHPLAAMMIDIDHFKTVNDTLGHAAGDAVLQHMACIMRRCVRETDILARYGGEEFVVLLPETARGGASIIAERLRVTIESSPLLLENGERVAVTISAGIATMGKENEFPVLDKLLQQADEALYRAKRNGRNRIEIDHEKCLDAEGGFICRDCPESEEGSSDALMDQGLSLRETSVSKATVI